jgi:Bacterial SH3 domain
MPLTYPARLSAAATAPALWLLLSAGSAAQSYPVPPQPAAEPASGGPATASPIHAVSLHAGPSGTSPVIGTLRPGMPVEILAAVSPGWLQVRSAAGEGWAWRAYFPGGATATAGPAVTLRSEIISP